MGKRNYFNTKKFIIPLPITICFLFNSLIVLPILFLFTRNLLLTFLILGFIDSFIGLSWSGKYLNKNCLNDDLEKCKKCKNWNCTRDIRRNKKCI